MVSGQQQGTATKRARLVDWTEGHVDGGRWQRRRRGKVTWRLAAMVVAVRQRRRPCNGSRATSAASTNWGDEGRGAMAVASKRPGLGVRRRRRGNGAGSGGVTAAVSTATVGDGNGAGMGSWPAESNVDGGSRRTQRQRWNGGNSDGGSGNEASMAVTQWWFCWRFFGGNARSTAAALRAVTATANRSGMIAVPL